MEKLARISLKGSNGLISKCVDVRSTGKITQKEENDRKYVWENNK